MSENFYHSESKNQFSGHAQLYSKARPKHPKDLISYIVSFCNQRSLAWDVATGNGQAANLLAEHFEKVIATDLSQNQLDNAAKNSKISYHCESAEDPTSQLISENSVDLITVAVALHWIPQDKFYERVNKVLKPNGIFAAFCYFRPSVDEKVDAVNNKFDKLYLQPVEAPQLKFVRGEYTNISWCFDKVDGFETDADQINRNFHISQPTDLTGYLNLLSSYSTTQVYIQKVGKDPIKELYQEFLEAWGGDPKQIKKVKAGIFLRVGKKMK